MQESQIQKYSRSDELMSRDRIHYILPNKLERVWGVSNFGKVEEVRTSIDHPVS